MFVFQFPEESLCTKLIHNLLGASDSVCSGEQKVNAVKSAWLVGHEQGLLPDHMYPFGIQMLKLENELSSSELFEVIFYAYNFADVFFCAVYFEVNSVITLSKMKNDSTLKKVSYLNACRIPKTPKETVTYLNIGLQ